MLTLAGETNVKTDVYDVYFADYSEHPDLDTNRFTLKILLEMRNGDKDQKVIVPRLSLNLSYLDKPVGKIWTTEELVLEPYKNDDSDSAGLLPLYITLYVGGKDSGLIEFINGLLLGEIGAIEADITILLGDIPINLNILLGEVLTMFGGQNATGAFDASGLMGMLGGEGSGDDFLIPKDYIFLKNSSYVKDIRALLNVPNATIFRDINEILICGAKDKFNKIEWKNATNDNYAVGDGIYQWQYWAGDKWKDLSITDGTNKFTQSGTISFSTPSDWKTKQIVDFFDMDYYYVQCKVLSLDSGVNLTVLENATYMRMNVKESHVADYSPPSSSSVKNHRKDVNTMADDDDDIDYPELDEEDLPLDKGLLQTDMEIDEYFGANDLDFSEFLDEYLIGIPQPKPGFLWGMSKAFKTPWINETTDDDIGGGTELEPLLKAVFGFLASHNIDMGKFMISCEFEWVEIFQYIGEHFTGWSAPDGIDIITGEDIYSPISETSRYINAVVFSYLIFGILIIALCVITPYLAQKKVDQSYIFKDIKNLDIYMNKVRKEMEKGISEEEISLLKKAAFKKTAIISKDKNIKEGDSK